MRYRVKDYKVTVASGTVYVHINVPDGDEWLVINPVKEALRLIIDETAKIVFCSSMKKDQILSVTSSEYDGYKWKFGFSIPAGKSVATTDKFTIEFDWGESPEDMKPSFPTDYAKEATLTAGFSAGAKDTTVAKEATLTALVNTINAMRTELLQRVTKTQLDALQVTLERRFSNLDQSVVSLQSALVVIGEAVSLLSYQGEDPAATNTEILRQLQTIQNDIYMEILKQVKEVTYNGLKALRDSGLLVPGQCYRITDYVTTVANQDEARSAGHPFDLVVTAIDDHTLSEHALAARHAGDTYFEYAKMEAWQVWYCIDNDTDRFSWADEENGKGVIYRLIDEFRNDVPYDFKNVQFKRYRVVAAVRVGDSMYIRTPASDARGKYAFKSGSTVYLLDNEQPEFGDTVYTSAGADSGKKVRFVTSSDVIDRYWGKDGYGYGLDTTDWLWAFTFGYYDDGEVYDWTVNSDGNRQCHGNTIKPYGECQELNNIVIVDEDGLGDDMYGNTFGENCHHISVWGYSFYGNTFGNDCYSNSFGNSCYSNSFGNECNYNSFGNYCNYNSFGNGCYYNTFGNECYYNSFGNECYYNSFGNYCYRNSFGNECNYNSFGNECYYNSFGNECYSNSFGNDCGRNSFGNSCSSNSFGNDCYSNSFGNSCYYNSFGNDCYSNSFGNDCCYNSFGNDCYSNSFGNSFQYNSFGNDYMQYCTFGNGVQYCLLDYSTGDSDYLQYVTVLSGTKGSNSSNLLELEDLSVGVSYPQTCGFNSDDEYVVKNILD